jgi:hypothetical protein
MICYNYFGDYMKKVMGDNEVGKLFNIFTGVTILFIIFYVITSFVTKKQEIVQKEAVSIQYEEIIVGTLLNQKESSYYVLAMFEEDMDNQLLELYANKYLENNQALPVYKINLSGVFNKSFIAEASKLNITNIESIKFSKPTLLLVKDNKIDSFYETSDKIISHFKTFNIITNEGTK